MSELQKESWGWLGEHVHASAPQSPRLQLPRSTTSPSQGVITAAAAGAAVRLSKVAVRAAGGAAAAGALPPGGAGQLWPWARCPPSARRDGTDRGEAASALAHDSKGRRSLWVKERELAQELEKRQEEKPSESPPAAPLCAAAGRLIDIVLFPPLPAPPTNRRAALPHRPPPKRGRGYGAGPPGRFRSL